MPRKASFDVESFENQIIETILHSPVAMSRRAIFDKCRFNNDSRAMLSCFDRLIKKSHFQLFIVSIGDKKNRAYISKNPPKPIEPTAPRPLSSPKQPLVLSPSASEQDTNATEKKVPLHRPKPPEPTFEVQVVDDAADVIPALTALTDASGNDKLAALGVDKRSSVPSRTSRAMGIDGGGVPVQQIILAAGDIVYDFDIAKILKSVYATSDTDNIRGFAPFRDFFANHTIVSHDTLSTCAPLFDLDIPPRAMQETRLAVRMLQHESGIVGDDDFDSSVGCYLNHIPYSRRTAITGSILPLFRALRERLGDELTTFETYCLMLPRLARRQKPFLLSIKHPDLLDCVDLPSYQQVHPTFEIRGDGGIQLELSIGPTSDVKAALSFGGSSPISLSKKKEWWSHFSIAATVRFGSKSQTHQILSVLSALESAQVVFRYNETVPERMAIFLMRIIESVVDDAYIRLHLANGCNGLGSGKAPVGWRDAWWDSWVDLASADVQSVLIS